MVFLCLGLFVSFLQMLEALVRIFKYLTLPMRIFLNYRSFFLYISLTIMLKETLRSKGIIYFVYEKLIIYPLNTKRHVQNSQMYLLRVWIASCIK